MWIISWQIQRLFHKVPFKEMFHVKQYIVSVDNGWTMVIIVPTSPLFNKQSINTLITIVLTAKRGWKHKKDPLFAADLFKNVSSVSRLD